MPDSRNPLRRISLGVTLEDDAPGKGRPGPPQRRAGAVSGSMVRKMIEHAAKRPR